MGNDRIAAVGYIVGTFSVALIRVFFWPPEGGDTITLSIHIGLLTAAFFVSVFGSRPKKNQPHD